MARYSAKVLRYSMPGYIGGKEVAEKATNKELVRLAGLQDKAANLHNRLREPYYKMPQFRKKREILERQLKRTREQVASLQKRIKAR